MPLSFDQSGSGAVSCGPLTLPEVQQLCCDCGFVKPGVEASKPLVLRADTAAFFKTLGVNSWSAFRELFYNSRVAQPKSGQAPPPPAPKKQAAAPAVCALRPMRASRSASETHAHLLFRSRAETSPRSPCRTLKNTPVWRIRTRASSGASSRGPAAQPWCE